jgi:hypothetical protein
MALAIQPPPDAIAEDTIDRPLSIRPRRILIGYSMRSGSTLLSHVLGQHSQIESYSDLSAFGALARLAMKPSPGRHLCVKPMDVFYLSQHPRLMPQFNRFVWLTRDPRDSYLSTVESGYAYLLWPPGRRIVGIDTGLLRRWQRITQRYLACPDLWHRVRYEELTSRPDEVLGSLFDYLGIPSEELLPFDRFKLRRGGDYKIRDSSNIHSSSVQRWKAELNDEQRELFASMLGPTMKKLGYEP